MQNGSGTRPTVLIVDDERDLADAYAIRIQSGYETQIAYDASHALEVLDESIDVVLLDRRMPSVSGEDILDDVRERAPDAKVIMTSAIDPDVDIVELPIDDYLRKPIDGDELLDAIERQLSTRDYGEAAGEYVAVASKIAALESARSEQTLDEPDVVRNLKAYATELEERLDVPVSAKETSMTPFHRSSSRTYQEPEAVKSRPACPNAWSTCWSSSGSSRSSRFSRSRYR